MAYRILLIFFLALLSNAALGQDAAERRYRVELIVLMHLDHAEQPRERKWLDGYADTLDFLTPPEESDEVAQEGDAPADERESPPEALPESDPESPNPTAEESLEEEPFADVAFLPELGEEMQEAWRRLRLSGPFRPLQFLAWEQSGSAPFPQLRIHDQEVVLTEDPWAEQRAAQEEEQEAALGQAAVTPETPMADTVGEGAEAAGEAEQIPPPLRYYRLDGTAQLRRSRFLHLALDIEWREPVFGDADVMTIDRADEDPEATAPQPEAFLVYRLEQTRQVRTARMEYFDGPVLGVLARITRVHIDENAGQEAAEDAGEAAEDWQE